MRILVVSDSHGNGGNLRRAIMAQPNAEVVIHLGDGEEEWPPLGKMFLAVRGNFVFCLSLRWRDACPGLHLPARRAASSRIFPCPILPACTRLLSITETDSSRKMRRSLSAGQQPQHLQDADGFITFLGGRPGRAAETRSSQVASSSGWPGKSGPAGLPGEGSG